MSKILNYFPAIRSIVPYVRNIQVPRIQGSQKNVFVVNSLDGTFICKFNCQELAKKNAVVSQALINAGIRVPDIKLGKNEEYWLEVYPIIDGKTLYEHIGNGLSGEKIQYIYHDIVYNFSKMDSICINLLENTKTRYIHQVARRNISDVNNKLFGFVFSETVKQMNKCPIADIGVYHCCLTPKNIIVDENEKLAGFVDLDEIAIADKNYAFGMMAAKYQQVGQNPMDLVDYYENISGNKLNRKKIQKVINLTNIGKSILWHNANKKKIR